MKTKKNLSLRILYNCILGVLVAMACNFSPALGAFAANGVGLVMYQVNNGGIVLFEGLAASVWVPLVKQDFYPDGSFITSATDMSSLVNNDTINFAEAGADPAVLKNNTSYPINATVASDSPLSVTLDTYDTESTIVRNAVAIELVYDQRALYAGKHQKALRKKISIDAAYAYAPTGSTNTSYNPIVDVADNGSLIDATIDLQKAFNDLDVDGEERNLVYCPAHLAAIAKEDKVLYKAIMATPGSVFYGFKIWTFSKNPIYITSSLTKAAQGTAYNSSIHKLASFAFLDSEVMSAMGTVELFSKLKDPDQKGDVFNFQMRALVAPLRDKYRGAITRH